MIGEEVNVRVGIEIGCDAKISCENWLEDFLYGGDIGLIEVEM